MAKLIALHGWAQTGKDTAAGFLAEKGWECRAFADPLRELAEAANPIVLPDEVWRAGAGPNGEDLQDLWRYHDSLEHFGYNEAKNHGDFRDFLQRLGNGARQVFGDSFWVDQATTNITADTVWADCRYFNEADSVRSRGGIVVQILRDGTGPANDFERLHHSMGEYSFDVTIENSGSLALLRETILEVAREAPEARA